MANRGICCADVRGASDGSRGSDRRWRFALKLRLEDGTADADALLYGQDGEDFFQASLLHM